MSRWKMLTLVYSVVVGVECGPGFRSTTGPSRTMNESESQENRSDGGQSRPFITTMELKLEILAKYYPIAYNIDLYLPIVVYIVGFFGNSISAVVWLQQKLRKNNSSAIYLALLSINDLVYLILHCIDLLGRKFDWKQSFLPLYCEVYMYFIFILQYMSPLFVLGFTGERFIAICYPLRRKLWCRTSIAKWFVSAATLFVAIMSAVHPLFWTNNVKTGYCGLRPSIPGLSRAWFLFSTITESIFFITIPMVVLGLDMVVICALNRLRQMAKARHKRATTVRQRMFGNGDTETQVTVMESRDFRTEFGQKLGQVRSIKVPAQTTTALLLTLSIYEALTMMTVSILYLQFPLYPRGDSKMTVEEILSDPTWLRYFRFNAAQSVILPICLTRHGSLIFFFLAIGTRFRETLCDLLKCHHKSSSSLEVTRSSWLRSSISSQRTRIQVEVSH